MSKEQQSVLDIAGKQVGKCEIPAGSNWGPAVQEYLASVGIKFPAAWCASFVYWIHKQAGLNDRVPKTGGVLRMWHDAAPQYKFKSPAPGDVFIMDFGKGMGHTGIVTEVCGPLIKTIEGNTNSDGSRDGFEVAKRVRKVASCVGFLRFYK